MRRRLLMAIVNSFKWLKEKFVYIYNSIIPTKIAGFNKWDEDWELGEINQSNGIDQSSTTRIRTKGYISVIPNATYYLKSSKTLGMRYYDKNKNYLGYTDKNGRTTVLNDTRVMPDNCYYMRFIVVDTTTYNHDICINESDPNKNGTYVPYNPYKVLDKSRIAKIEGNSEVVNQLIDYTLYPTLSVNGITYTNNNDGSYTLSGVASGSNSYYSIFTRNADNHYYLIKGCAKGGSNSSYMIRVSDANGNDAGYDYGNGIVIKNTNGIAVYMRVILGTDLGSGKLFKPETRDLTHDFPFDTPTSINDPRVQRIIEKGYIPFNTGEIQNSIVGEIEGEGFNIWNEEWGNYYWDEGDGGVRKSNSSSFGCVDYIKVIPNTTYNLHSGSGGTFYVLCYDKNKNLLSYSMGYQRTFTTPNNCFYITFYSYQTYGTTYKNDICINISNTELNGTYKPHIANQFIRLPQPLELESAGLVHNTFEITQTEYVFTRNVFRVDLGSINWVRDSIGYFFYTSVINYIKIVNDNTKANILCAKYQTEAKNDIAIVSGIDKSIATSYTQRVVVKDNSYTDANVFKSAMSGVILNFELATPQVIRIPRKHLKAVDLGSLSWTYDSSSQCMYSDGITSLLMADTQNMYCYLYMYDGSPYSSMKDMTIRTNLNGRVFIKNTNYTNATDFTNAMKGVFLFYETENEVQDFNDELECQSGGIMNVNLFSWNKNQLIKNGNFAVGTTNWKGLYGNISVSNNAITWVCNNERCSQRIETETYMEIVAGHKYLGMFYVLNQYADSPIKVLVRGQNTAQTMFYNNNVAYNTKTLIKGIFTSQYDSNLLRLYHQKSNDTDLPVGATIQYSQVQLIDLTKGFGVGNEPTDINDYRIKRILELGYIPTDIVGTSVGEIVDTLPNVEMAFKCKK